MMERWKLMAIGMICATVLGVGALTVWAQGVETDPPQRLAVLWTSGDPDVAHRVALMYTHASITSGWWDEVVLIVWGPSQRLLIGDHSLQDKIQEMMDDGITVRACQACADSFGVTDDLRALGIEVLYMGQPLTEYLQSDWEVMTF